MEKLLHEFEVEVHRDFATKKEVARIDSEVQILGKGQVALETTLKSIDRRLESMGGNVQWGVRWVVGILLTGIVGAGAAFIVQRAGLL